jgi:hypothetical protein
MPAFEKRAGRNNRLLLGVTANAAPERVFGGGMLLLMTGSADLIGRLALCGVGCRDLLVALLARPGLGARIGVGPMAAQASLRGVNLDRRRICLSLQVAMRAIARLVSMSPQRQAGRARFDYPEGW